VFHTNCDVASAVRTTGTYAKAGGVENVLRYAAIFFRSRNRLLAMDLMSLGPEKAQLSGRRVFFSLALESGLGKIPALIERRCFEA
jgi:hypothetical protein